LEYNFSDRTQQYVVENASNGSLEYLATLETIDNGKPTVNQEQISLIVSITSVILRVLSVQMKEASLT
jgi:hypothetical protein